MSENIFKYPDVEWSLPLLLYADYIYGAIYNSFKDSNIKLPKVNLFGTSACAWSGGRNPSIYTKFHKNKFSKMLNYVTFLNATPSFTFTSTGLTDKDFDDPYCNMMMEAGFEANARFIVFDDKLRDYIKSKNPKATVVASVIKPIFEFQDFSKKKTYSVEKETAYYNKLLKEYDIVVVRPEYSKFALVENPNMINDLSRIEVLINQQCTMNCPRAVAHYSSFEQVKENRGEYAFQCHKMTMKYSEHFDYNINSFHSEESLHKLNDAGVKRFKVQGRSLALPPNEVYINMINHIVKYSGSGYVVFEHVGPRVADEISFYKHFIA